ncbi:MAG TPA: sigma-70 family RNA polymerase sigma factor [Flavobacteriales bacterium]|nr:sigma-70 family RNA polymerase sigma factor [Flavobacteriales bacterium]
MNDKQLELIEEKYGRLIHKIGHWISGDNAIASHADNTQDIWIAAMEAIRGYEKKESQTFDEFWGTRGFDKYLKTCLWNVKNSKGAKITKKYPITKGTVDIVGNEEVLQREERNLIAPETEVYIKEIREILTKDQAQVVRCILDDPRYIKPSGKVNINALAKEMGKTWNEVNALINQISNKIENDL